MRDGYELGLPCAEIAMDLPGRTASAVVARAAKLGLASYARVWTAHDDQRLRSLTASGAEVEHAARALARTPEALRARARKLGLSPLRSARTRQPLRRWTPADDEKLRLHVGSTPPSWRRCSIAHRRPSRSASAASACARRGDALRTTSSRPKTVT